MHVVFSQYLRASASLCVAELQRLELLRLWLSEWPLLAINTALLREQAIQVVAPLAWFEKPDEAPVRIKQFVCQATRFS